MPTVADILSGVPDEQVRLDHTGPWNSPSSSSGAVSGERPSASLTAHKRQRARAARPAVGGGLAEVGLDAQQLVVLGHAVRAGRGAGLDLPAVRRHGEVGDRGVLGLAAAVAITVV